VNTNTASGYQHIFQNGNNWNNGSGFILRLFNGKAQAVAFVGPGNAVEASFSSSTIPVNQWVYLTGTYDGRYTKVYVDGVLDGTSSGTHTGDLYNDPSSSFIGRLVGSTEYSAMFSGLVDEVRVWDRALSENEVFEEYKADNLCVMLATEVTDFLNLYGGVDCEDEQYLAYLDVNKDKYISPKDTLILITEGGNGGDCEALYDDSNPCEPERSCNSDKDCSETVTYHCETDEEYDYSYACIDSQEYRCEGGVCVEDGGYGECGPCYESCDGNFCSDMGFPERDVESCSDLMNFVIAPYSFSDEDNSAWILDWQYNWSGREYFGGRNYEFTLYEAYFSYEQQFPYDNYNGWAGYGYSVYDFEEGAVDLDSFLREMVEKRICEVYEREDDYGTGDANVFYVCDSGLLWNFDYEDENYRYSYGDVYWVSGNRLIRVDFHYFYSRDYYDWRYYEKYLDDYEKILYSMDVQHGQLAQTQAKISSQLDSLFDNEPTYVSPLNVYYYMPWHVERLLQRDLAACPSDLVRAEDDCYPNWQCILEPAVCPEHGYQTRRCEDTNGCFKGTEEGQVSCNPGICSGCMMPKDPFWSWGSMDTKCMPYGARFEYELLNHGDTLEGGTMKDDYGTFEVEVKDEYSAVVHVVIPSEDIDETIYLYEDNFAKFNYVRIFAGEPLKVFVENIVYNENQDGNGYVVIKGIDAFNAYCDYDGQIKEQKMRLPNGDWAKCQNNFECESNFCSTGECIEIQDMLSEIGGMREIGIKVLCRFADMFGVQNYDRCVMENLGQQT